jgi:hypothetical protein
MIISQFVDVIFLSFCCSSVLLIWFETNAVYEYLNYFNLGGRLLYKYNKYKEENKFSELNLPSYLLLNYNCFSVRLITCSICLCFWLSLIPILLFFEIALLPFVFVTSLFIYYSVTLLKNKI